VWSWCRRGFALRRQVLAEAGTKDAFGHAQLGGVGPVVAQMTQAAFGYKFHWAVADYLQRSARHIASKVDVEQAYAVGKAAVELALQGKTPSCPHREEVVRALRWGIGQAPLAMIANREKKLPRNFITRMDSHHRSLPPLSEAAHRRRGLPALSAWIAHLCQPQGGPVAKRLTTPLWYSAGPPTPIT